jgi:hypothetical protein
VIMTTAGQGWVALSYLLPWDHLIGYLMSDKGVDAMALMLWLNG